jgi:hypothetical protein
MAVSRRSDRFDVLPVLLDPTDRESKLVWIIQNYDGDSDRNDPCFHLRYDVSESLIFLFIVLLDTDPTVWMLSPLY